MKRLRACGTLVLGGAIALQVLTREPRRRFAAGVRQRVLKRMQRVMAGLPEDAPPKLIMSVLPRLRQLNDEILRMLREHIEFLREPARRAQPSHDLGRSSPQAS